MEPEQQLPDLSIVPDPPEYYEIEIFGGVVPNLTDENSKQNLARAHRNRLLADSDYTQVADYPMSDEKRAEWSAYRQELRDLPDHPDWPNPPEPVRPT